MARTEGVWLKDEGLISPSDDVPILLLNSYLNFGGLLVGADGYGIRDNAGVMEVKSDSGAWSPLLTAAVSASPEFEKVSKNLDSWETASVPPTYDADGNILVITMKSGVDTRLKTLAYTNGLPTTITLSGSLPVGLPKTIKTLSWSVDGEYQGATYT